MYGNAVYQGKKTYIIPISGTVHMYGPNYTVRMYKVHPKTVSKYIFTDHNGKDVYENDYVTVSLGAFAKSGKIVYEKEAGVYLVEFSQDRCILLDMWQMSKRDNKMYIGEQIEEQSPKPRKNIKN